MSQEQLITEQMEKQWESVINNKAVAPIESEYKRKITTRLLENTKRELIKENSTGNMDATDPIIMGLVRRTAPNLLAYDICGVQAMTGPTGLVFAMRSFYNEAVKGPYGKPGDARPDFQAGGTTRDAWADNGVASNEAFYNEADSAFSGTGTQSANDGTAYDDEFATYTVGSGMSTEDGEFLGRGESGDGEWNKMTFTIEKVSVTAKTRALKAHYTEELAQDMKAVHGLDAHSEIANILSSEIVVEENRELVNTIRRVATIADGAPLYENGSLVTDSTGIVIGQAGLYNIDTNSDGRWSAEKYKSLLVKINREANAIAKRTRRGRGNLLICSSDVVSILDLTGKMVYAPAIDNNLHADDTGPTFIGTLQGRFKVYVDPYLQYDEIIVGFKGSNPMDAGVYFCPYVPMQLVQARGENDFQPRIGFKTRRGLVANPYTTLTTNKNAYYTKFKVVGL